MPLVLSSVRGLCAAFLLLVCAEQLTGQNNVLVVLVDDLGTDYLAAYGEAPNPPPTPVIDDLARTGVRFDNAWSTPLCSSTRASVVTGRHPFRTGVGFAIPGPILRGREVTIPELLDLRNSGYAHGYFGKWHIANPGSDGLEPNRQGFSWFAGIEVGFSNYYGWFRTVNGVTTTSRSYQLSVTVDDTLDWVGRQSGAWFAVFAPMSVHSPWQAPPANLHTQDLRGLDPAVDPVPFHRAMVEAFDAELGRLLQGLGAARASTDVIFLSDNGTQRDVVVAPFDENRAKGTCYEGGVRVPLIVNGPSVVAPGRTSQALVGAVDVLATVADLAGVDGSPPFLATDSVSFEPVLGDPQHPGTRTRLFTEVFAEPNAPGACASMAMRDARYKVIRFECPNGVVEEFYDLANDPRETRNLFVHGMTTAERTTQRALSAAIDDLRYPLGSVEEFGRTGCTGTRGELGFRVLGRPRVGRTYSLALDGLVPFVPVVIHVGSSETNFGGIPLPLPLERLGGGPGCEVAVSADMAIDFGSGPTGSVGVLIPVPPDPLLVDAVLRHQAFALDPTAPGNALGLVSTRGLRVRLGD